MDAARRPAMLAMELLEAVADSHYTTELGLFNLEINLDPLAFGGDCLRPAREPARIRLGPFESGGARTRRRGGAGGDPADLAQVGPGDGAHDPQATLSGAQRGAHAAPRRRVRVPAQGRRRVEHPA